MRTWVCGTLLAVATAGGVVFVFAGVGSPSHCGPCLARPTPAPVPDEGPVGEPVTDVVDVAAILSKPPTAERKPFVSFDEPPLARIASDPRMPRPMPGPEVVQATFTGPPENSRERAPMPRPVRVPGLPLFSPTDPY